MRRLRTRVSRKDKLTATYTDSFILYKLFRPRFNGSQEDCSAGVGPEKTV